MAHDEQVRMWECVLETSGAAPLSAAGPLRWVRSVEGYRLVGSHVPAQEPSEIGRSGFGRVPGQQAWSSGFYSAAPSQAFLVGVRFS